MNNGNYNGSNVENKIAEKDENYRTASCMSLNFHSIFDCQIDSCLGNTWCNKVCVMNYKYTDIS